MTVTLPRVTALGDRPSRPEAAMLKAPWGQRGPRALSMAYPRLIKPPPPRDETGSDRLDARLSRRWRDGPRSLRCGSHAASFSSPRRNEYYPTQEASLYAIADAMREEYQHIGEAGFLLQIDDPRLVSYYGANLGLSLAQCLEWAELRVEVLNDALRDIPPEKLRYHTCYGMNIGPRIQEVSLQDVVHLLLKINAGAYSLASLRRPTANRKSTPRSSRPSSRRWLREHGWQPGNSGDRRGKSTGHNILSESVVQFSGYIIRWDGSGCLDARMRM